MEKPVVYIASGNDLIRQEWKALWERLMGRLDGTPRHAGIGETLPEELPDLVLMFYGGAGARSRLEPQDFERVLFLAARVAGDEALKSLAAAIGKYLKRPSFHAPAAAPAVSLTDGHRLVGESLAMRQLRDSIRRVSASDANVLITGETGTGKELVAHLIRLNGTRRSKPFVCVNCAAIPDNLLESELFGHERGAFTGAYAARPGMLELADGGTVFFDEVGDMSPYAQAKILRAIESKEVQRLAGKRSFKVDVRIIAATNQELEGLDGESKFRRDLYYRLNVARIHVAPLRERKSDIPLLISHYVAEMNHQFGRSVEGVAPEIVPHLLRYDWPGNVRELKNVLEAMFVELSSGPAQWIQLPDRLRRRIVGMETLTPSEQERLLGALWSTGWNISKAARQLHWSRMTVYRKMAKYQLHDCQRQPGPAAKPLVSTAAS